MSSVAPLLTQEVMRDLYFNQGLSFAEIGRRFGCSNTLVSMRFRAWGLKPRPGRSEGGKFKDMMGQRFNRLIVKACLGVQRGKTRWLCDCDCGKSKSVAGSDLRGGVVTSCGCYAIQRSKETNTLDLTGHRYGLLTVVERALSPKGEKPRWLCQCDCGTKKVIRAHNLRVGTVRSCGCLQRRGLEQHPSWKGGRRVNDQGYVVLTLGGGQKPRLEHRVVMERVLGRPLLKTENVHHKNGIRTDNRPENLEIWIKVQPCGQRIPDIVAHAEEMLRRYAPEKLALTVGTESSYGAECREPSDNPNIVPACSPVTESTVIL